MNTNEIVKDLEEKLPIIGRNIARESTRLTDGFQRRFIQRIDSPWEHYPRWHQWGIVSHSLKAAEYWANEQFTEDVPKQSQEALYTTLNQEIEGIAKQDLIHISLVLHDLGKFNKGWDEEKFDFNGHEEDSQRIILEGPVTGLLSGYSLTSKQINYVANCAGKHFELGYLRREAKLSPLEYTQEWINSSDFNTAVEKKLPDFRGYEPEVGLMYLADSWAKVDPSFLHEAEGSRDRAKQLIYKSWKPEVLVDAVMQQPVSMAVGRKYLEIVLEAEK